MAHSSEQERRSRKKSHTSSKTSKPRSSSKKAHPSQAKMDVYTQSYAPPVQAVSAQYLQPYQPHPQRAISPSAHANYGSSPPQHPVYGRMPPNPPPYTQGYGLQPQPPVQPYASQSAIRFASPPPMKTRGSDGPFKEQWDKFDRMAAKSCADLRNGTAKSATKITTNCIERPTHAVAMKSMQALCHGAALCDMISSKFDAVINSIDGERFSGQEQDLLIYENQQQTSPSSSPPPAEPRGQPPNPAHAMCGGDRGSNHFSKVWLYSNSRLPPHLPPFKVYMPTYPLLCLAATYSERVYTPPRSKSKETETHVAADWRTGTKAMVLKSIPVDDMNTVVFAIRGSEGFMDWAVNYNTAPSSPEGFLEDPSNLCHAGFLYVAKRMIKPVADRLRVLLEENPSRSNCSLLITGHSAGGAVAALLYAHMMSTKIESELSYLTGFFKRVHCITFGAPPISLRALQKPEDKRHRKSLFYAFINEGDPIPRADKPFIKSLLKLYASPAPSASVVASTITSMSKLNLAQQQSASSPPKNKLKSSLVPRLTRPSKSSLQTTTSSTSSVAPAWPVPLCTLAPAGRLIVLRPRLGARPGRNGEEVVEAVTVDGEMLKKVMYGDPMKHQMRTYRMRIEGIATRAVTGGGF
ncbi:Alpha/Beta hydrolase protein [Paraphoma chrysanthemicola]|uniref:Alpha/Beta hydrolase protein n=1 Tax=Paraphoma chrysanthemicola TaxID=798071 RepID=A0A8K0QY71_9PLEO|nr:Alpha/Beta hydrolase protein [Paraphoma chrysanthemicola]